MKRLTKKLGIKKYVISGSYRRGKWYSNDIDLLVPVQSESEAEGIKELMKKYGWKRNWLRPSSDEVFREQFLKKMGKKWVVLDLFCCPPGCWGNALLFTTGSRTFNDIIRARMCKTGYSWSNPRYFEHLETSRRISFSDERSALSFLGIKWVKPSRRL